MPTSAAGRNSFSQVDMASKLKQKDELNNTLQAEIVKLS